MQITTLRTHSRWRGITTRPATGWPARVLLGLAAVLLGAAGCSAAAHPAAAGPASPAARTRPFLLRFHAVSQIASTVPANGDVNPYGITMVPQTTGRLIRGDILVSNFNSKANVQGTGTTIVEVSPHGTIRPFARLSTLPPSDRCPGGVGLTTGLEVLPGGWVAVGSLPTAHGGALPAVNPTGCLIVWTVTGRPWRPGSARTLTGHGT